MQPLQSGLRLLQWNVLLDSDQPGCVDDNMRQYTTHVECLEWQIRSQTIARKVQSSNVDVAILEECSPSMFADLIKLLTGYEGWQAGILDGGLDAESMEIAIFVKSATVEVLGTPRCSRLHWLCEEGNEREVVLIAHTTCGGDIPPSAYVVLSAAVRRRTEDNSDSAVLVVAGTHLRWEYGDGFGGAAAGKPLQALAAVRHLWQHVVDTGAIGWTLVGDFNSRPDDASYELLTLGKLSKGHAQLLSRIDHDLRLPCDLLQSAFKIANGCEPRFTRKKDMPATEFCLDYVFVGGSITAIAAGFGAGDPPYGDTPDDKVPSLPNAEWPSDHLPLVVDIIHSELAVLKRQRIA